MGGYLTVMDSSQDFPPPVMRQDLSIFPDEADEEGAPQWVMHDPLCNRFFSIRQNEVELLPFINGDSIDNIIINARQILKRIFGKQEVEALFNFLRVNNLVVGDAHQQAWYRRQRTAKPSVFARLARSYLFFRIPLWRPENFLEKTAPFVSVLTQKRIQVVIAILGFAGLFLVTRQFDRFLATFPYLFNLQGIFLFATSLMFVKILHELGHAYSAKFQGCKVPVIGVAILLGRPVLYTDTSDVWRLASRNARLEITAAGIKVEFAVAALALFAWNFTSDGILCTIFFLLATTTWITSVFINFNPFLRYDGYYLLSDLWRIPNLEQRAFAMAKWFIHNKILGLEGEPPEPFKIRLVVFAFSAWIYRFLLFLGIALLVYHFFFKLLGIFLFVIEIAYFIVRPVYNEISSYYKLRDQLRWNRTLIRTLLICFFVLGFCFFPWSRTIHL
ncbi:MAG: hypothetical protein KAI81_04525, partial [Candidatus Marinimicrobia bacterium]|nr:hypothetical protein [Candidatus Neomarinimicrobiota bacterium]